MGQPVKPLVECVSRIVGRHDVDVLPLLLAGLPNQSMALELDYDNWFDFCRLVRENGWEDQVTYKGCPDGVKAMWGQIAIYIVKPVTMWVRA